MSSAVATVRGLLYSSAIYGAADVIVLAVGGLLLLPLYTRTLSQPEFGDYVIVKTNAELFTYVLYFGLPSAAARVYFDHRKQGRQVAYMSSVLNLFMLCLVAFGLVCGLWGERIWKLLSPGTPSFPYLWFSVALASTSFFASLGPLWLRLEGRVHAFVTVQICASLALAATAVVALVILHAGLGGIIVALLISALCSSAVLPWLFGRDFRPAIQMTHVTESLHYAVPTVVGYVAYFILNRIGTVILQRHVASDQIAIFGLAQQLATLVTVIATAFGKAMQPAVFGAEPQEARELLDRSARLLIVLVFCITSGLMMFGWEAYSLIAPPSYGSGYGMFLILVWANMAYSFNLLTNTALFYKRRPKTSMAITIAGAALAALLGLWLIPLYRLEGAVWATAGSFFLMMFAGQWASRRFAGHSYLGAMLSTLAGTALLGVLAGWFRHQGFALPTALLLKGLVLALACGAAYLIGGIELRAESKCRA